MVVLLPKSSYKQLKLVKAMKKLLSLAQLNSKSAKALVAKTATTASKNLAASAGKQSIYNFNLVGLKLVDVEHMPALLNGDVVGHTEVHHLGNREWTIEVYDRHGNFMREFVGYGNSYEHEPSYLWRKYNKWLKFVNKPAKDIERFEAPDGKIKTLNWFYKEAAKGILHELTLQSL